MNRLAHRNALGLADFLDRVGQGKASADPARVEKYPQYTEMYVNRAGLEYLAVLAGEPASLLQRVLPGLAERHLLPDGDEAVWKWPWQPFEGHLARCCPVCAQARGVDEPAWVMTPDSWSICVRHLRWSDDSRAHPEAGFRLRALPEVVAGHGVRVRLARRFGRTGEELFADAFLVAAHWWASMPHVLRWVQRAWTTGLDARDVRVMPLVVYPEAAQLARLMLRFEQSPVRDRPARSRWLGQVGDLMETWYLDIRKGTVPLLEWLERHRMPVPRTPEDARTAQGVSRRRRLVLALGHNRLVTGAGSLEQRSCLPWQPGASVSGL
ncbi:hypothetical protein [Streptomyces sp. NPDC005078]|uniref:hypothetical protein n=1 Tax=unclassified Streptomyces TaxID=2593676 RepID=UPI0033A8187E